MRCSVFAVGVVLCSMFVMAGAFSSSDVDSIIDSSKTKNRPLNIAVVSLPFYGHFLPVKSIGEKLARRGHNVTLLNENTEWCRSPVPNIHCLGLPNTGTFPDSVFHEASMANNVGATIVPILEETNRYHTISLSQYLAVFKQFLLVPGHEVDLIVSDSSCFATLGVSSAHKIPAVFVFPLILRMAIEPLSWMPLLGSEDPREADFLQRWKTFALSVVVNSVSMLSLQVVEVERAKNGIRPSYGIYEWMNMHTLTFAPTIWGYDAPHPQWPALQPAGILMPELEEEPLEDDLLLFLESDLCASRGVVYVNFGTLSQQTDRAVEEIYQAMSEKLKMCVVWKLREPARLAAHQARIKEDPEAEKRIYLSKRFATPVGIMGHPSTFVFVTHCGDTSLGEAISSELPVVGIPFFADQADVCARMSEAGLGEWAGHKHTFTASDLASSIVRVAENRSAVEFTDRKKERRTSNQHSDETALVSTFKVEQSKSNSYLKNILQTKAMAAFYGGPTRAAETIENHFNAGLLVAEEPHFFSPEKAFEHSKASVYAADSIAIWLLFWCVLSVAVLRWIGRKLSKLYYSESTHESQNIRVNLMIQ